jgi:hypothetical protein
MPSVWWRLPVPACCSYFTNVSLDGCPRLWDIDLSNNVKASCTVLIDTSTNQTVAHWVETDHVSDDDYPNGYERAFIIWPSAMLKHSTR